jgi:simple sugar transport system permease protein
LTLPFGRKHIPVLATALVLVALFATASGLYRNFFALRVFTNLFFDNAVLGILAIGMTFVILSGGIDLSVGSVVAFTTVFIATMIRDHGMHPCTAWGLALLLGAAFGAAMGLLIHCYRMPAFLVTLGGMFFARGMAFVVNMQSVGIEHPLYRAVVDFRIPLPRRAFLPAVALVFLGMFAVALYLAHLTRFGRNVYAVGGDEESALLMGLPVGRTRVWVFTFNGFCSALAGIAASFYMGSGNPAMGFGLELDAIASVVIGGTLLTGGVGYVAGTMLGVLIFGTIDSALKFDGRLSSWWLRISIGLLLLLFILMQKALSVRSEKRA